MTTHIHLMATSLSSMIAEYVEEGIKHGYEWQGGGLTRIIERRLERLIKAHGYVRELDHREPGNADEPRVLDATGMSPKDAAKLMLEAKPGDLVRLTLGTNLRKLPMVKHTQVDIDPDRSAGTPIVEGTSPAAVMLNAIIKECWNQAFANGLKITHGLAQDFGVPVPAGDTVQMDRDNRAAAKGTESPTISAQGIAMRNFYKTERKHLAQAINDIVMNQTHIDKMDFVAKLRRALMQVTGRSKIESGTWFAMQVTEASGFTIDELWGQYESRKPAAKESEITRVKLGQVETESDAMRISIQRVLERLREQIGSLDYGMYEARFGKMMSEDEHWVDYTRDELLRAVVDLTRESLGWHYARAVDNE